MKRIDWKVYVLLGIIVSVVVGFLYGTGLLGGDSSTPGSSGDPLLTQGYADGATSRRFQELDDKIAKMEADMKTMRDEIRILTGEDILDPGSASSGTPSGSGSGTATTPGTSTGSSSTAAGVSATNVGKSATVTADVVNLRESASTSSNIKKRLTPSDTFTITKADKEWYQVQCSDGTVGWVFGDLVKIK